MTAFILRVVRCLRPALKPACPLLVLAAIIALPHLAHAQAMLPALTRKPTADGGQQWSIQLQTLLLLTSLAFLPAALLIVTCFTRIVIVLRLLRPASGQPAA